MGRLQFSLEKEASGSRARAATFKTLHSTVQTPVFMPVGTQATVKSLQVEDILESGSQVVLANTYHLLLRPGPKVFEAMGGIHNFMKWPHSVLTDSGGFQIFSLPHARNMTEEGAQFRSYVDGKWLNLSPETSIGMQRSIGSDIMMVLDQCVPSTSDYKVAKAAMELTHRWAARSLTARGDSPQSVFAIVQGACYEDLRRESAKVLTDMPFDGFAIGGLAVGETKSEREDFTELSASLLPKAFPRYLMGVGTPIDLLEAVHRGVDMFDCILPTALAQQGVAFTSVGKINLRRQVYKFSDVALDPDCQCRTCQKYSVAYLHHLTKAGENLGWSLVSNHNLHFYHKLMAAMRKHILADTFAAFYREQRERLVRTDTDDVEVPLPKRPKHKVQYSIGPSQSAVEVGPGRHYNSIGAQKKFAEANKALLTAELTKRNSYWEAMPHWQSLDPLLMWDIGLGSAENAVSLIKFHQALPEGRRPKLDLVSFTPDPDTFFKALHLPYAFPHIRHTAPYLMQKEGSWTSPDGTLSWTMQKSWPSEMGQPHVVIFEPRPWDGIAKAEWLEMLRKALGHVDARRQRLVSFLDIGPLRAAVEEFGAAIDVV